MATDSVETDQSAQPRAAPAAGSGDPLLRQLAPSDPWRWIAAGWHDFLRCPHIGLFYGGIFFAMGWATLRVFESAPAYSLGLSAGFLLLGPALCMGLYDASARLERGERPSLRASLTGWLAHVETLGILLLVLLVLELLWSRASLIVFAVCFNGMPEIHGTLATLLAPENTAFLLTYLGVGAPFAALIFGVCVLGIPMILDRRTDAITASLLSLKLSFAQPGVMALWAMIVALSIGAAMLPGFLGLVVVAPVIGHASWHAYRAAVVPGE